MKEIKLLINAYLQRAAVYNLVGNNKSAIVDCRKAYLLSKKFDQKRLQTDSLLFGQAFSLSNIGVVYINLSDYSRALKYHGRTLDIRKKIDDQVGVAESMHHIARVYLEQNDFIRAKKYLFRARKIVEDIGQKEYLVQILLSLGELYLEGKTKYRLKNAKNYIDKALQLVHKLKLEGYLAEVFLLQARLAGVNNQPLIADEKFKLAMNLFSRLR